MLINVNVHYTLTTLFLFEFLLCTCSINKRDDFLKEVYFWWIYFALFCYEFLLMEKLFGLWILFRIFLSLTVSISVFLCLCVSLSLCLSVSLSLCLSVSLSLCLSVSVSFEYCLVIKSIVCNDFQTIKNSLFQNFYFHFLFVQCALVFVRVGQSVCVCVCVFKYSSRQNVSSPQVMLNHVRQVTSKTKV